MLIYLLAAGLLSASPPDKWELKPAFEPASKAALRIKVDVPDANLTAEFTAVQTINSVDEKGAKAVLGWKAMKINGQSFGQDEEFQAVYDKRGILTSLESQFGDELRRMVSPMVFVYPEHPVDIGDKWEFKFLPRGESKGLILSGTFEAKAFETYLDNPVMKVGVLMQENGEGGLRAEGNYWVAKDGRVMKLELSLKDWPVPMAGQTMNAKLQGTWQALR